MRHILGLLLLLVTPCLFAQTASPSLQQVSNDLDLLLDGRVFKTAPFNLVIEGMPSRQTQRNTIFADMLLSGVQPERYSYFLFRKPSRPTLDRFDVVFFNADGSGYAVGIPTNLVLEIGENRMAFSFLLKGGGEAGRVTTRRTFSFSRPSGNEARGFLNALLEEESVTSSIWSGRRKEKCRIEIQFEPAEVTTTVVGAARQMSLGKRTVESKDEPKGSCVNY